MDRKKMKGVTLVELIIYAAIMAIILGSVSSFIYANNKLKDRNQAINETDHSASEIMEIITQSVRNSVLINSPAIGFGASSLSVNTDTAGNNPTIFDLSGGKIRIKEGNATVVNLNNDKITLSNLAFKNLGTAGGKSSISVKFDASYVNTGRAGGFEYVKTFYGSASLR